MRYEERRVGGRLFHKIVCAMACMCLLHHPQAQPAAVDGARLAARPSHVSSPLQSRLPPAVSQRHGESKARYFAVRLYRKLVLQVHSSD